MPRAKWSGRRWPESPPLMTSLKKNPHPKTKIIFFHWKLQDLPSLWLRLQPFKIAWALAPQPWHWQVFRKYLTVYRPSTKHECSRSPTNICDYDNSDCNCAQHCTDCRDDYCRHTGIACHVAYNAQGTPLHHGFSLLISVECACVKHYPWLCCTR